MVRYFGFLANRVCGEKLPQVYRALGMDKPAPVAKVCYAQMVKQFLSRDPFELRAVRRSDAVYGAEEGLPSGRAGYDA
ncbi:Transposase (plasmid) [Shigella dysenteriae WRSd5]|nr:Transposase [Shigella dysenteriae WRSd5]